MGCIQRECWICGNMYIEKSSSKVCLKTERRPTSMDFELSVFLINNDVRLMVPQKCYVQHIGFNG
ncbi:hypothetical protein AGMMS49921_05090 [Endomicrobiia bacterium]|nr:hypothetical protein AGMMS49921_05090 [Endomicrobiia bacterium]